MISTLRRREDDVEILKDIVLILHFLGLAAIIGGVLAQRRSRSRRIDALVLHGALTQLVTGVALVGLNQALANPVDNTKIGVKLVVLLVIGGLAWRYRKARHVSTSVWAAIGGLTVVNIAIAVLWR
jgi:hypothetical protein